MIECSGTVLVNSAEHRVGTLEELRDLARHSHLLASLVRRDLTVRYKRSVIGFFWTMLNPLLLMIILTIVFSTIFKFEGVEPYAVYFLSEYLVFGFFTQTTVTSMTSLAWNRLDEEGPGAEVGFCDFDDDFGPGQPLSGLYPAFHHHARA